MEININRAIKIFFPNPSLEMVFVEAIANAIDAGADSIKIKSSIKSLDEPNTLEIRIEDNGDGFSENNFKKFSKLLESEGKANKGSGRLIFLHYFRNVEVFSHFGKKVREFDFTEEFEGKSQIKTVPESKQKTVIFLKNFRGKKLHKYTYLSPKQIKQNLIKKFLPYFYILENHNKSLKITIETELEENKPELFEDEFPVVEFSIDDLPKLSKKNIKNSTELFGYDFELLYSVKQTLNPDNLMITAICADRRIIEDDIINKKYIPDTYEAIFLLYSKALEGKTDFSRKKLENDELHKHVKTVLIKEASNILNEEIPSIKKRNAKTLKTFEEKYPHLHGYFSERNIGLIDKENALNEAKDKFFRDQKKILEAEELSEEDYSKSIELSSRVLTEYILYRNFIIDKLKKIDYKSSEADIHNIILPMRKEFDSENLIKDIYSNNAWLLDDKYMTFSTVLSDMEMEKVLKHLTIEEQDDKGRPDIAFIFSKEPSIQSKADVVIVELKKLGLESKRKNDVHFQLMERAKKLLQYYPDKIQRIWFYGVIDIDEEFELYLKSQGYEELYSNGALYFKPNPIFISKNESKIANFYIQDFKALVQDASDRNFTFLEVLKNSIKTFSHA